MQELERALINADAAGDTQGAKILASEIIRMRQMAPSRVPEGTKFPLPVGQAGFANAMQETLAGASPTERALAGFGSGARNLYEGAKQLVGMGDPTAIEGNRQIRQAAPVSAFAGDVASFIPTAAVPGLNTMAGATTLGGLYGGLQPAENMQQRGTAAALGAAGGAAGQYLGGKVGNAITNRFNKQTAEKASQRAANAVKDQTMAKGRQAGYSIPPSAAGKPSLRESVGGQIKTQQMFSWKNQQATNKLWRDEFGLPENAPITNETMAKVRYEAAAPYRAAQKAGTLEVGPSQFATKTELQKFAGMQPYKQNRYTIDAGNTIEQIKQLRADGYRLINSSAPNYDPAKAADGRMMIEKAAALDDLLAEGLKNKGQGQLANQILEARTLIAKTHMGDDAIVDATGDVIAKPLAKAYHEGNVGQGPRLTGNLETIGQFAQAFPQQTAWRSFAPLPNSALDAGTAAITLGAGQGHPAAMAAATVPYMRNPIRNSLAKEAFQNKLMNPQYEVGLLTRGMNQVRDMPGAIGTGTGYGLLDEDTILRLLTSLQGSQAE
jgi:hypothetical protein